MDVAILSMQKIDNYGSVLQAYALRKMLEKFDLNVEFMDISMTRQKYDLCVIGSDEVFNCLNTKWWRGTSQLFGNIPEAERIITYVASCGATRYENVPEVVQKKFEKHLKLLIVFLLEMEIHMNLFESYQIIS